MEKTRQIILPEAWSQQRPWLDHPEADIDAYVASLGKLPDYDLKAKLHAWKRDGIVIFEGAVSHKAIDAYLADIDLLIRNFRDYEIPVEVKGKQLSSREMDAFPDDLTGVKLNQMHWFSKTAARLSLTPQVTDFLKHVFRAPPTVCQSLTFWRGSEQPIHIDYPYVREQNPLSFLAASWVPLEDVHPDAGPLGYYPGAHNIERSGFFDWGEGSIIHDEHSQRTPMEFAQHLWAKMAAEGISRQEFCPKKGDVLIWHGNMPHEGTRVKDPSRTRKSYVSHYTAEWAAPDWMRNHDIFGRPVGLFENGGNSFQPPWVDTLPVLPSWGRGRPLTARAVNSLARKLINRFR
mgnify:CR=1 FL=1